MNFYRKKQWNEALECFDKLLDGKMLVDTPDENGPEHQEVIIEQGFFQIAALLNAKNLFLCLNRASSRGAVPSYDLI